MKTDTKILRWLLLGLYIGVITGLLGTAYSGNLPSWLFPSDILQGELFWILFLLAITVSSQVLFIFGAGTINLCRPIRRRRLVVPVMIASLMMTVLVAALFVSIAELLHVDGENWFIYGFWIIIGLSWIAWSIVFFIRYRDTERYKTLRNLISIIIAGSVIQLLAAIPSHIMASRRPGCFVGLLTAFGIVGGIAVMLWAFGPGIILLFLHEKYKAELQRDEKMQHCV